MNKQLYILNGQLINKDEIKAIFRFPDGIIQILLHVKQTPEVIRIADFDYNLGIPEKLYAKSGEYHKEKILEYPPKDRQKIARLIEWIDEPDRCRIKTLGCTPIVILYLVD